MFQTQRKVQLSQMGIQLESYVNSAGELGVCWPNELWLTYTLNFE